jgi:hypothetical protein
MGHHGMSSRADSTRLMFSMTPWRAIFALHFPGKTLNTADPMSSFEKPIDELVAQMETLRHLLEEMTPLSDEERLLLKSHLEKVLQQLELQKKQRPPQ